jgi:peptidoglycan glycosyltransferase
MVILRARRRALFISATVALVFLAGAYPLYKLTRQETRPALFTKESIAEALGESTEFYKFPGEMELPLTKSTKIKTVLEYAFDPALQESMESLFREYRPDYGAFVAMDAQTGRILSIVSYSQRGIDDNLVLRSDFPSASVFKVVTAAAAIEQKQFSSGTVVPFNGRAHTLYRQNVLQDKVTRWTSFPTLKDAFAKSINTVFGKIGNSVGREELAVYANRFGFNRKIAADLPLKPGVAEIPGDTWGIAESASGFTRDNTMSPLQGALIASAIANDGTMMEPYVVRAVYSEKGEVLYNAEPKVASLAIDSATAAILRELMSQTITHGTSRKAFRGFFKKEYTDIDVGGKTGSLTGDSPRGKYDWFVGYGIQGEQKIAVAALTIHEKLWRVKSSYLARRAFEQYFKKTKNPRNLAATIASETKRDP